MLTWGIALPGPVEAAAPHITSLVPAKGPITAAVTIKGTGLGKATKVTFAGVEAKIVSQSATAISTRVPIGAHTGSVRVTTPGGTATSPTNFKVTIGIALAESTTRPTGAVHVSGSGFTKGGRITLLLEGASLGDLRADAAGVFVNAAVDVPSSATPGSHVLTALDVVSGRRVGQPLLVQTDWPMYGFDAAHTNYNRYENVLSASSLADLKVAWSAHLALTGGSSVAVSDGVLYVVGREGKYAGRVFAFATDCGVSGAHCTPLWTAKTGDEIYGAPAVANGVVYVGSYDGYLYAFDARCRSEVFDGRRLVHAGMDR
jgi:hypothetical protein